MSSRPPSSGKPKSPPTTFIRDLSGGVNLSTQRESIADNEAWWMEGVMPIAPGNLAIVNGPATGDIGGWHTAVNGESGAPSFMYLFNIAGNNYIFAVWSNSGNGWIGDFLGISVVKRFAGTLTSGQTGAAQWNNQGLLIIDPIGYWDWNVTAANTLTTLNNSVQSVTLTDTGSGYTGAPVATITGGGGTGATAATWNGIGSFIVTTPGINYKVGDPVSFFFTFAVAFGFGSQPQMTVTTVNAVGGITGVSITNPGQGVNAGANPASVNLVGGSGSGAVGAPTWIISLVTITNQGHGYTSAPSISFALAGAVRVATALVNISGFAGGTAIASYAGRAWFASNRTITFTDAGSYNSFIGSGSQFTIQDDYLSSSITALFAANQYLYIFSPDSIDVLSNVTITSAGTASFSRVNITASIGCSEPSSIFSHYRAVVFAGSNGFYSLSGASPEKISDSLDLLLPQIDYSTLNTISGGQVTVNGILCAAWRISFSDIFITNTTRTMLVVYFKGRWFFASQAIGGTALSLGPIVTFPPVAGSNTFSLYTIDAARQYYLLFFLTTQTYWRIRTKLYDAGKPLFQKQATRAGMGVQMGGSVATRAGLSLTIDTELHDPGQTTNLLAGTFSGYKSLLGTNNEAGGQFMGMGVNGVGATQADITSIRWLAYQFDDLTTEWVA